jgi:hypothetical protein
MKTQFTVKPSAYFYSCGHQWISRGDKGSAKVYKEHGIFHVIFTNALQERTWETYRTMGDAEKAFKRLSRLC